MFRVGWRSLGSLVHGITACASFGNAGKITPPSVVVEMLDSCDSGQAKFAQVASLYLGILSSGEPSSTFTPELGLKTSPR
jgi:hypothetical protein